MHHLENSFFQAEAGTGVNGEYEYSPEFEFSNEFEQPYTAESAYELAPEFEWEQYEFENFETSGQTEMELAQELQAVSNEAEFLNWLKKAAKKTAGVASNLLDSPAGRKATSALTNIARKTLSKGGSTVQRATQAAADRIPDFVRFATDALRNLANEVNAGNPSPVKPAIVQAAAKHYPIILRVKGTLHARQVPPRGKSQEFEWAGETNTEYNANEMEGEISNMEGTFNEVTEMELASELLTIQSEAELDQFLGKLFKKAAGAVSKLARSPIGRSLGGMLKGIAKKALPLAGSALGSVVPGVGTAIGGAVGSAASNLFELELEGLSAEDREFELSRAFVRFAGNAARRASRMRNGNPSAIARQAVIKAARRYAPGLLLQNNSFATDPYGSGGFFDADASGQSGNWYRQGDKIVIQGLFQ